MSRHLFILVLCLAILPFLSYSKGSDCVHGSYFECSNSGSSCQCPLDSSVKSLKYLSMVAIFFNLILIAGYIGAKGLREQPGDFFFGFAIGEAILNLITVIEVFYDEGYRNGLDAPEGFCLGVSAVRVLMRRTIRYYHCCYVIYYLMSLRHTLRASRIGKVWYHLVPWVCGFGELFSEYRAGSLGKIMIGICDVKFSTKSSSYIPELVFSAVFFLVSVFAFKKLYTRSETLGALTRKHLRYYSIYFVFANLFLVSTFAVKRIGVEGMKAFLALDPSQEFFDALHRTLYSQEGILVIDSLTPIILTIVRLGDPFLRQHWKNLFLKVFCCFKPQRQKSYSLRSDSEMHSALLENDHEDLRNRIVSLTAGQYIKSMKKKPLLDQVQHTSRVRVVYSLLAAIHYHWRTNRRTTMIDSRMKDDEYYQKKAKVTNKHQVTDDLIKGVAGDVLEEIRSKGHTLLPGRFTVYAPDIFEELTHSDGITGNLITSLDLGKNYARILKSGGGDGGRSGEFFFFSYDNRLIIKTVSTEELNVLRGTLPRYSRHFETNPKSLIAKIYAVFTFEVEDPYEEYHLIVMKNVNGYPTTCTLRKYDLKGSTVDRSVIANKNKKLRLSGLINYGTMKDKDFDDYEKRLYIEEEVQYDLLDTLVRDVAFLRMEALIDYSLVVYLVDPSKMDEEKKPIVVGESAIAEESPQNESDDLEDMRYSFDDLEAHNSQKVETMKGLGGSVHYGHPLLSIKSTKEDLYYHLGIIDYLTKYDWKKRGEKFYKQMKALNFGLDTSCQDPHTYNRRFLGYMEKIIIESHISSDVDAEGECGSAEL